MNVLRLRNVELICTTSLKLLQKLEAVHDGHVDVEEDEVGDKLQVRIARALQIGEVLQRALAAGVNEDVIGKATPFNHLLVDEVVDVVVIDQHHRRVRVVGWRSSVVHCATVGV